MTSRQLTSQASTTTTLQWSTSSETITRFPGKTILNDVHSVMEDTVKRIRGHVYRGTFSQSHAAKMFMPLMQDLLEAYDRYANTLEDMDSEVLWFELLDLPQRYELCDLLLEGLGGYIHNYRSSRRDD